MRVEQTTYKDGAWSARFSIKDPDIVFVFAEGKVLEDISWQEELENMSDSAIIVGCSSSGVVFENSILDDAVAATAIKLEKSSAAIAFEDNVTLGDSLEIGKRLAKRLMGENLKHIIIFSDGLNINGSKLSEGFNGVCPHANISVSGGLAGDGYRFFETFVIANSPPVKKRVAAVALYGDITVKTGCFAGWDEFGAERTITKSDANILYEVDGENALDLYKKYLGEEAKELPTSGLKFPLSIKKSENDPYIIRTLLSVDEKSRSLTFAGDMPQSYICKLMKSNPNKLIENAGLAAKKASCDEKRIGASIAVSCVGRRIALGGLVEEELEALKEALGDTVKLCGFYSYGEIAPTEGFTNCFLHNQTMTVTTMCE